MSTAAWALYAKLKAPAGDGHDARGCVREVDLVRGRRPRLGRRRRPAPGLLAGRLFLGLALRDLLVKRGLLPRVALLGTDLDRALGFRQGGQPRLAKGDLLGQAQAIGKVLGIRLLGALHQSRHFRLELGFQTVGIPPAQRLVAAGVGLDLGPVQTHLARAARASARRPAPTAAQTAAPAPKGSAGERWRSCRGPGGCWPPGNGRRPSRRWRVRSCGWRTRPWRSRRTAAPTAPPGWCAREPRPR
jgi:hypothetical protein